MADPRTILITGASAGIGRDCAARFLALGWNVALIARRADPLAETAGDAPNALVLPCDVTDAAAVDAAFDETAARFGRIDVLFNNAGLMPKGALIDELSPAEWRAAVEVNLTGMFLCARAAFARMRRQAPMGGRIINNGSVSAHAPRPGSVAYTSTKHAITGLTKTLELDGRAFDITCGQIDIGNARTELAERIAHGVPQADGSIRPEPMMEVVHVTDAVVHMANLPAHVNIPFLTVMAARMPFLARG
ncbi:SDR family NAD(P)-dependent oxidoreductase [Rhodobacteraceae bacterium 2376]|uniref:SDR family NAD(P)-dependent oxidoreductase n=1 Tax=Rhabdonatronobacter sediminivivens TaxID=2743469 RepID=A0A7Z0HX43_9RHOB|nr:SDR family NAD(P)-dependent oxidoreductase [Rhabdonatronobacter sediminivivens]NYS23770.1 SDR family NAD(P)-dependent oxidoreductase [Rhabdonatronobacter sediminivivens]